MMNKKIKTILIDDEINARENLRYLIENYCPEIEIINEAENVDEAIILIEKLNPDLVFLDIEMPQKNGFELVKHFNNINFHIIFATAYDSFAIKAFEVSAVDYLLKPIDIDRLKNAVEKVHFLTQQQTLVSNYKALKENIKTNKLKKLSIPYKNDYVLVDLENIFYFEASRMYCTICVNESTSTSEKNYTYAKKLKHFEETLCENTNFIRVHRSWIVNLKHVISYSKKEHTLLLRNNKTIPISKNYKDILESLLEK